VPTIRKLKTTVQLKILKQSLDKQHLYTVNSSRVVVWNRDFRLFWAA